MSFTGSRRGPFHTPPEPLSLVPPERRARTVRRIAAFFGPYRAQVAIVLVAILATSGLGLINPILLKLLIDDAIPRLDFSRLNLYVGLMIGLPILSGLIGVGQSYLNNVIGQRVMADLRDALYRHLQRMPLRFFRMAAPPRARPTAPACHRNCRLFRRASASIVPYRISSPSCPTHAF
jgi:ABC-type bacteriocin/lantibiotic exporter with double-glycine peptidase domain